MMDDIRPLSPVNGPQGGNRHELPERICAVARQAQLQPLRTKCAESLMIRSRRRDEIHVPILATQRFNQIPPKVPEIPVGVGRQDDLHATTSDCLSAMLQYSSNLG